jgi:hypothetical protein
LGLYLLFGLEVLALEHMGEVLNEILSSLDQLVRRFKLDLTVEHGHAFVIDVVQFGVLSHDLNILKTHLSLTLSVWMAEFSDISPKNRTTSSLNSFFWNIWIDREGLSVVLRVNSRS